jgi:hypothetical protein
MAEDGADEDTPSDQAGVEADSSSSLRTRRLFRIVESAASLAGVGFGVPAVGAAVTGELEALTALVGSSVVASLAPVIIEALRRRREPSHRTLKARNAADIAWRSVMRSHGREVAG